MAEDAVPICKRGHSRAPENLYRSGACKTCHSAKMTAWRAAHPAEVAAYRRTWNTTHKEELAASHMRYDATAKGMLRHMRHEAKQRGNRG